MLVEPDIVDLEASNLELINELRLPLVNRFYSSCRYLVKCGRLERVYALSSGGKMIAAVRLMPQESGNFLLRNLCVSPDKRNQGVASYMLREILPDLGSANCYCYALSHLQGFYLALGFKHLTVDQVPRDIAEMHFRNCARKRGWILMGHVNLNDGAYKQN